MLTKRQKEVLDFIEKYRTKKKYSPSLEEIRKRFKLASVSTAHFHVKKLEDLGYLDRQKNKPRSINVYKKERMVKVPILGMIAAGQPIEALENKEETIAISKNKLPKGGEVYALRVIGNSMIDENINDGDIILVKQQSIAENGQKIVALIDGSEATLKKFYKERGRIRLQPANKMIEPIIIKKNRELTIQGIVIDVIKNKYSESTSTAEEKIQEYNKLPLNKIICGDTNIELKKIPNNSIDLIIADPPYGISKDLNCKNKRLGTTAKLNFNFGNWDKFNKVWFDIATKKTKGWIISFCAKKDLGFYWNILERNGFKAIDAIVWQKPDPVPLNGKSKMLNAWETAIIGKKSGAKFNGKCKHNIFKYQAPKGKNRIHPTQKPIELIKELIALTTNKDDIVLDPFMGSGTTAVACILTGRNYIGFEVNKKYYKQSLKRIRETPIPLI